MPFVPKPKPCFLDKCEKYKVVHGKQIYRFKDLLYTWDGLHGEIEVFNRFGQHIMVVDPVKGEYIKDAVKGRRIDV